MWHGVVWECTPVPHVALPGSVPDAGSVPTALCLNYNIQDLDQSTQSLFAFFFLTH
jgi:hypothetical protein